ncbi:MAG: flavodoxin family protein, partial [Syntrophobacteraceae bacterium]
KYLIERAPFGVRQPARKALFLSAGATRGNRLFEGILHTMKYFLDTLDMELWKSLLYRGLEGPEDLGNNPSHLEDAFEAGRDFARAIESGA